VKTNKQSLSPALVPMMVLITVALSPWLLAQSPEPTSSSTNQNLRPGQWSVLVDKVDPGDINLAPSFQIAIYESLLGELSKTKRFKQVLRDGDRNASEMSALLTLKTTVEKYTPGSETRRAVTTVSGATKLTVRSQLLTRDGKILLERTVDGNVRFMGSNLRATRNLARNVAKAIKQSSLPAPSLSALSRANPAPSDDIVVVEFR
jgi:hypothetical protein